MAETSNCANRIRNGCGCSTAYRWARPEVADAVARLSPDRFRAVLDVLGTVTVVPVGKGGHVFNPERVQPKWRDTRSASTSPNES